MKNNLYKSICSALIFALILCLSLSFTSCNNEDNNAKNEGITFIDSLDREVTVKKNPQRVAALLGSFADVWMLAGGTVCATVDDAEEDFELSLENAVNIGGAHSPSLELLLSANPDFVIASASTASNVAMMDTLEAMKITVAYFDVDNIDEYLHMLDVCTDITGRKDLYEQNGTNIKMQIEDIKTSYKDADIPNEHRRVLLLRASSSFVKAKGSRGTILGEMLADMGCVNIADSNNALIESLSIESIIEEDPHHVFVVTMGSDTEKAMESLENMIKENPAWSTLTAIKEGRLHVMEKSLFNQKPNSRWAQAYSKLYEKLTEK